MEKFTSLSNIELMYIDGGFNAKGVWHKFTKKIKSCWVRIDYVINFHCKLIITERKTLSSL